MGLSNHTRDSHNSNFFQYSDITNGRNMDFWGRAFWQWKFITSDCLTVQGIMTTAILSDIRNGRNINPLGRNLTVKVYGWGGILTSILMCLLICSKFVIQQVLHWHSAVRCASCWIMYNATWWPCWNNSIICNHC